ncbi:NAD(P)H-binding protein [Nonomuraea sp. K274]|uniref:NAD(P)H-binding protein n=1 Tax=Nonomuraea cypriaca TaxID=1187855 RepID=A0A931F2U3_9ACTN|nr:NAD(P)H-binding protein [Nonomuraea cypriaca]MBF8189023.1 NAD(P)H-binding protein [Nonomuraea cypriaca]
MRLAVIGGTGRIGSLVVQNLNAAGHEAVPHSRRTGVDVLTGQGVDAALAGADVVVDLTNSPSFDHVSLAFFQTSTSNLLAAARRSGAGHFVILSIVGVDQVPELDHYRAKTLQEGLLKAGPVPYSIVRATQFMEFIDTVLSWTAGDDTVRLPRTPLQPVAAADVAATVAEVAAGPPLGGTLDLAGPDTYPLDELGRITLAAKGDRRSVIIDDTSGMYALVHGDVLTAGKGARIAPTHYTDWLKRHSTKITAPPVPADRRGRRNP